MDEKRQGEIALKLVQNKIIKSEMPSAANFLRELGNIAKEIGEETDTMKVFYESAILPKLIGTMLGRVGVTITSK